MPHSLDLQWDEAVRITQQQARNMIRAINEGEEAYQDLLEMVDGRSDQIVANQLFGGTASQEQLDRFADLKNAMVAIHQLWQCGNNVNTSQKDRFKDMRRIS